MSTSIQEQDLIQTIKDLKQRISDLERQQKSVVVDASKANGNIAVFQDILGVYREIGIGYNSINFTHSGGTPIGTQNVDINFNVNGFWLDYFSDVSGQLGYFRLSNTLNLRLDGHDTNIPTTTTSSGKKGEIKWNGTHLYLCIADNTWRRVALGTW